MAPNWVRYACMAFGLLNVVGGIAYSTEQDWDGLIAGPLVGGRLVCVWKIWRIAAGQYGHQLASAASARRDRRHASPGFARYTPPQVGSMGIVCRLLHRRFTFDSGVYNDRPV